MREPFRCGLAIFLGAALAAMAGCKSENACLATSANARVDPCAVATSSAAPACYEPPQACPDLSPVRFCARLAGSEEAVNVLVLNKGEKPMKITGVRVHGDTRCAFSTPLVSPDLGGEIAGGDSMILRLKYKPPSMGDDHVAIEVESDAENLPHLFIPVCGRGVPMGTLSDGGIPDAGSVRMPGPGCIPCQDRRNEPVVACGASRTDAGT